MSRSVREIPSYFLARFEGTKLYCSGHVVTKVEVVTRPDARGRDAKIVLIGPRGILREQAGNYLAPDGEHPLLADGKTVVFEVGQDAALKPVGQLLDPVTRHVVAASPLEEETLFDLIVEAA